MKKGYKFLREGLKSNSGKQTWKIGEWKKHKGKIEMCESSFYCSKQINQAFSYVQGEVLALVEVRGRSQTQDDKEVWSEMRIVKAWKWQKQDSVALAIYAAEQVIDFYEKEHPYEKRPREAIESAKRWLKNPTKKNRKAAWVAAWVAAWGAGGAAWVDEAAAGAAWAAWAAAAAAAAAWAAEAAAWAAWAAGAVLTKKIEAWMKRRVNKLEEIK